MSRVGVKDKASPARRRPPSRLPSRQKDSARTGMMHMISASPVAERSESHRWRRRRRARLVTARHRIARLPTSRAHNDRSRTLITSFRRFSTMAVLRGVDRTSAGQLRGLRKRDQSIASNSTTTSCGPSGSPCSKRSFHSVQLPPLIPPLMRENVL